MACSSSLAGPLSTVLAAAAETVVKTYITDNGLKMGEIMPVLRLALAGTMQGPTIFDMMALLGKEKSVARIKKSLNYFDTI